MFPYNVMPFLTQTNGIQWRIFAEPHTIAVEAWFCDGAIGGHIAVGTPTKNLQGMIQRTTIRWENAEELCVPENSIVHFFPSNFKIPTKYLLPRLDDDPMMKRVRTVQQNLACGAFYMIKALVPRFQVILFWLYSDFSWIFECLGWYEKKGQWFSKLLGIWFESDQQQVWMTHKSFMCNLVLLTGDSHVYDSLATGWQRSSCFESLGYSPTCFEFELQNHLYQTPTNVHRTMCYLVMPLSSTQRAFSQKFQFWFFCCFRLKTPSWLEHPWPEVYFWKVQVIVYFVCLPCFFMFCFFPENW